jgi:hypothetical protein
MKTKRLVFISCLTAATLIVSPALSAPQKKKVIRSSSKPTTMMSRTSPTRMMSRTSQVTPTYRYGGTRYYGGTQYYSGGTRYYYGGGFSYPYYGNYSYWPYSYYGYYPYSNYGDYYPYSYSYYNEPAYGCKASMVAQVQRRLGELGYYQGVIDGRMGPMTRAAISAFESRHNLVVDAAINPQLLARLGLS